MRRMPAAISIALAAAAAALATEAPPPADPWVGRPRADIVTLLGEPDSSKTIPGGQTLTYKLLRLDETAAPPPGVRVLHVPGVGLVGRMATAPGALPVGEVGIAPTDLDRQGRPVGTGGGEDQTHSVTWTSKDKTLERSGGEERPTTRGKIKLTFHLNAEAAVESWHRSPKK